MSAVGYTITTEGAVALTAATAKTVIGAKAHANSGLQLKGYSLSFDGVTASAIVVFVEIVYITWATNGPGTNSTSTTPRQAYGRVLTAGFTSGKTWSAEPTTLTVIQSYDLVPYGGLYTFQFQLGQEPDSALAEGFGMRLTAPAAVNARATMLLERI